MCFYGEIWIIISKLNLLPLLKCDTGPYLLQKFISPTMMHKVDINI